MLKQLLKTWPYLGLSIFFTIVLGVFESMLLIRMIGLFDAALTGHMVGYKEEGMIIILLACLLVPIAIVVTLSHNWFKQKANESMKVYYINKLFDKNMSEFASENNSKYLSCLTNDFALLEVKLIDALYMLVNGCVYLGTGLWMMWTVNPLFVGIGVVVMSINVGVSVLAAKPIRKQTCARSNLFENYTASLKEVVSAFHIIKSNDLYEHVHRQFNSQSEAVQHKGYLVDKMLTYVACVENTQSMLMIMGGVIFAGFLALEGYGTIGGILIILDGMHRVIGPSYMISDAMPQLFAVKDLVKKIEETLKNKEVYDETISIDGIHKHIRFEEVTFGYDEEKILDKVNMTLKKGGKYLIVGPSGGGKSTCLKLLRKYFNPKEGKVWVDEHPLDTIKKVSYFEHISNVDQKVFIFEDTLRHNLTLYKNYTETEIMYAVEKAGLMTFIKQDKKGLDRMLYENGKNISGGEKSRIAIARGLLEKADVILLDEAFSALDTDRAKEIEQSLLALQDVTVVHVSHVIFKEYQDQYDDIFIVKDKKIISLQNH